MAVYPGPGPEGAGTTFLLQQRVEGWRRVQDVHKVNFHTHLVHGGRAGLPTAAAAVLVQTRRIPQANH